MNRTIVNFLKRLVYKKNGEPISYGKHHLRYEIGTRPIRLKYLDGPDEIVRNDAKQIKYFLDNVRPGESVMDIGGHTGQYAVIFSSLVGDDGYVITFEPDPFARMVLKRNLKLNPCARKVRVEQIALSDTEGTQTLYSNQGDSMSSLARSGLGTNAESSEVSMHLVPTMCLDDYIVSNGLRFPHWIKLDTEGAEINILRGARKVLQSGTNILCELHPYAWNDFGTTFEELLKFVRDCGRDICYLDENRNIADGAFYGAVIIS